MKHFAKITLKTNPHPQYVNPEEVQCAVPVYDSEHNNVFMGYVIHLRNRPKEDAVWATDIEELINYERGEAITYTIPMGAILEKKC